jgi:hypothetical protein
MNAAGPLAAAREAAARHLDASGYPAEAALVRAGEGDDFAEVRIALSLLTILSGGCEAAAPAGIAARRDRNGHRVGGEEC